MKMNRQAKILELIESKDIETQEQLLVELEAYRYSSAPKQLEPTLTAKLNSIFRQSVIACDHAQNIVVIKTMPGLASAACSAIDAMSLEMIVGTLAGDDTAFLLMRDTSSAVSLCSDFKKQIG